MLGTAKSIFQLSMILSVVVAVFLFEAWGLFSILAGVGVFTIGTFISFLIAEGKDLDSQTKATPNPYDKSPLLEEFNEWCITSKSVMHKWINQADDPFIKKSLLAFITMSIRTLSVFVQSIELAFQTNQISKSEYKSLVESLREDRTYYSTYKMELLISHFHYFHLVRFINEYSYVLRHKNLSKENFLDLIYDAKDLNWKGMVRYNVELEYYYHNEFINYYRDTLRMLNMNENDELILRIAKSSYESAYNNLMDELVNDTLI